MENLPDGVTFVPSIDYCGKDPELVDSEETTLGCATVNGTKVAILMDLVRQKREKEGNSLGPTLLHELLHAYGFRGHTDDANNVMASHETVDAP